MKEINIQQKEQVEHHKTQFWIRSGLNFLEILDVVYCKEEKKRRRLEKYL